ncbi:glycosyltransferase family 2 protein [Candidatus Parcubacteria bacterium]|nr:glycosyltransferase family 2 protein [Candidatus Parcubacteria bacterium]
MPKHASPKVFIITPIHNGISHTTKYIESVQHIDYPNYGLIIVDDGSTDGSSSVIKSSFPDVEVLQGDGGLWWSGATNLGIKAAIAKEADYVLTMNNDVILDSAILRGLVEASAATPKAIIGAKIYYRDDPSKVWYFGAKLDSDLADIVLIDGEDEDFTERQEVDMLTGMGMLIPIKAFSTTGLFDAKNFPQYFGDSDFSLRAKSNGYRLIVDPASKVYADVDSSWVSREMKNLTFGFFTKALFSIRSQFNIIIRYKFYKRYWGKGYLKAFLKFYAVFFRAHFLPFLKHRLKMTVGKA